MELIKLQKYFSDCGIMSRRSAEEEIKKGRVKVNGETATLGMRIDPNSDTVEYNGKAVKKQEAERTYILLNKPRGYVTTLRDEKGRKTVSELVADVGRRIYPVGRLDMDSDGLLLLTDDGELTNVLTHPRHEIPKIYRVTVTPVPDESALMALRSPMVLDGYEILPVKTELLSSEGDSATLCMTLFEGRNRQIRKMCASCGLEVKRLCRIAIGDITLGTLQKGKWRHLTSDEIEYLKRAAIKTTESERN